MGQISGAIIGVTVVLISVFVPLAFFAGSVGNIYRQFSAVMAASIGSRPSWRCRSRPRCAPRCSSRSRPATTTPRAASSAGSTAAFAQHAKGYEGWVARMLLARGRRYLVIYVAIVAAVAGCTAPAHSFLPNEDQGNMLVNVQLPPGATLERTLAVMEQVEGFMLKQPEVKSMVGVLGFSFSGQGQNAAWPS
jgi:multidrug efflux pump